MQIGKQHNKQTLLRKPSDNKKKLLDILNETNIIKSGFTGKIVIHLSQGGLQTIEKIENIII